MAFRGVGHLLVEAASGMPFIVYNWWLYFGQSLAHH